MPCPVSLLRPTLRVRRQAHLRSSTNDHVSGSARLSEGWHGRPHVGSPALRPSAPCEGARAPRKLHIGVDAWTGEIPVEAPIDVGTSNQATISDLTASAANQIRAVSAPSARLKAVTRRAMDGAFAAICKSRPSALPPTVLRPHRPSVPEAGAIMRRFLARDPSPPDSGDPCRKCSGTSAHPIGGTAGLGTLSRDRKTRPVAAKQNSLGLRREFPSTAIIGHGLRLGQAASSGAAPVRLTPLSLRSFGRRVAQRHPAGAPPEQEEDRLREGAAV